MLCTDDFTNNFFLIMVATLPLGTRFVYFLFWGARAEDRTQGCLTAVRRATCMLRRHPCMLRRHPRMLRCHPNMLRRHPNMLRCHPSMLRRHPNMLCCHPVCYVATLIFYVATLWRGSGIFGVRMSWVQDQ